MKNILLPTDFSHNSRNAAAYALQFFRDTPCTFHLLHVIPVGKLSATYLTPSPAIQAKFDELLNWLHSIRTNPKHRFTIAFKANFLIEAVRAQILEKNIDLILMGTKGATNQEGVVIGRNTSDVMMKVKCPILAISENAVYKKPEEILFPTDYKIPYEGKMLNTLYDVVKSSRASVKVLELFATEEEPTPDQETNKQLLQSFFAPIKTLHQAYYPAREQHPEVLLGTDNKSDLIVMAAKNLNVCHKLLLNHQGNHIPFIRQLPLLILH